MRVERAERERAIFCFLGERGGRGANTAEIADELVLSAVATNRLLVRLRDERRIDFMWNWDGTNSYRYFAKGALQ